MSTLNKLKVSLNKEELDKQYDVFSISTSEDYIKYGSCIFDVASLDNRVVSVCFDRGNRLFLMLEKSANNYAVIREVIDETKDDTLTFTQVGFSELFPNTIYGLLLNSLGRYPSGKYKFNNITGKLLVIHPKHVVSSKTSGFITKIHCLEISVNRDKFKNMMTAQYMVGYLSPKKKIEKLKAIADGKATKERKDCIDKIVGKFDKISKESNKYLIEVQNNFTNKNYLQRFIALQSKYANNPDDCSDDIKLLCDDYLDYVKNLFPKDVQCDSLSVKQHDGNDKAEGQMHIKNTNFDWHLYTSNNFVGWLSYKDLIDILK